ncbi:MAG TPA: hypothetical protein VMI06_10790 [Terriglobia bacterium]|nr:hypothetical protein [Terriglobia bacterium]
MPNLQALREASRLKLEEILSEEDLERIEADPELHRMMSESEEDIRARRVYTREQVDELLAERSRRH